MYIGILQTYYALYAVGETEAEVKKLILKAYKDTFPIEHREFRNPTFKTLDESYCCNIYKIDPKKGYAVEGQE